MDFSSFCDAVRAQIKDIYGSGEGPAASTPICCAGCGKPTVKPATVLYGRSLPPHFFSCASQDFGGSGGGIDLFIIAGTSLTVYPAAGLPSRVSAGVPRLLVNLERVGEDVGLEFDGGDAARDGHLASPCDEGFLALAKHLGWLPQLTAILAEGVYCDASRALVGLPPLP